MKIRLLMLSKTRAPELRALQEHYIRRIRAFCPIEVSEIRPARRGGPAEAARNGLAKQSRTHVVLLDAAGREWDSQEFARWIAGLRDRGTQEVVFACGDAAGFPAAWRSQCDSKISLSRLTMAHELARVVLLEQIYRAFTILRGHPYAK